MSLFGKKSIKKVANVAPEPDEDAILALDIGTEFVKAVIAKKNHKSGELEIIGVGRARQAQGNMFDGAIADMQPLRSSRDSLAILLYFTGKVNCFFQLFHKSILSVTVTVNIIRDKTSVEEDIRTSIRGVRYEQLIMTAIPFFIVFYMNLSSGSFLAPLYEGLSGRMIMSLALLLIALGFGLSNKICDIRV